MAITLGTGCASSARNEFLSLRREAPRPARSAGTTLAEAEMSNIGPSLPPKALATGR